MDNAFASLHFWCPKCGTAKRVDILKNSDHTTRCDGCGATHEIRLTVVTTLAEPLWIERDEEGMPTAIRL